MKWLENSRDGCVYVEGSMSHSFKLSMRVDVVDVSTHIVTKHDT